MNHSSFVMSPGVGNLHFFPPDENIGIVPNPISHRNQSRSQYVYEGMTHPIPQEIDYSCFVYFFPSRLLSQKKATSSRGTPFFYLSSPPTPAVSPFNYYLLYFYNYKESDKHLVTFSMGDLN